MRVIAFMNQKGGVGKTTSTLNVAAALCNLGEKILAIDLDPQANLTRSVGIDPENIALSVFDLLSNKELPLADMVQKTKLFDIIPSNISLASAEGWLSSLTIGREWMLKEAIEAAASKYDLVLIDCPPALGNLTTNAMVASTDIIVVIKTDNFSRYGTNDLRKHYEAVKKILNPNLKILGVIANTYNNRRNMDKDVLEMFQERFLNAEGQSLVFKTPIRPTVKLSESPAVFQDIFTYDPDGNGAEDYMAVTKEIIERLQ